MMNFFRAMAFLLRRLKDDEDNNTLMIALIATLVTISIVFMSGYAWLTVPMHLVTDKERQEAKKAGRPEPKSYWIITEEDGSTSHLEFENEQLAQMHYDFKKEFSLGALIFGGDDLGVGDTSSYEWTSIENGLPPYRPQQSLYTNNTGLAGQCTWYAADRVLQLYGIRLPGGMGNGGQWASNAKRLGYRVDKKASVGSAVCFPAGCNVHYVSPQYGHIAILEKINTDGSIVCSEFWGGVVDYKLHYMTYSASEASQAWYIHFKK